MNNGMSKKENTTKLLQLSNKQKLFLNKCSEVHSYKKMTTVLSLLKLTNNSLKPKNNTTPENHGTQSSKP